jgi:hypothetical protein
MSGGQAVATSSFFPDGQPVIARSLGGSQILGRSTSGVGESDLLARQGPLPPPPPVGRVNAVEEILQREALVQAACDLRVCPLSAHATPFPKCVRMPRLF